MQCHPGSFVYRDSAVGAVGRRAGASFFARNLNSMGRDQFERFCMDSGFRIKKLRNYRVTTNSLGVTQFPNMIKDIEVTRVNQVFVSDITYFDLDLAYIIYINHDLYNR